GGGGRGGRLGAGRGVGGTPTRRGAGGGGDGCGCLGGVPCRQRRPGRAGSAGEGRGERLFPSAGGAGARHRGRVGDGPVKPYVPGWLRWLEARVPAGVQAGAEGAGGGGDGGLPGEDGLWSPKSRPLRLLLLLGVLGLLLLTWGSPPRDGGREGDPSFGGPVPEAAGVTFRLPDGEVALDV